jgi:hypothetical protein
MFAGVRLRLGAPRNVDVSGIDVNVAGIVRPAGSWQRLHLTSVDIVRDRLIRLQLLGLPAA